MPIEEDLAGCRSVPTSIPTRQSLPSLLLLNFCTGTTSLPAELNRILNSIKDLDERSDGA